MGFSFQAPVEVVASAARTATGQTDALRCGGARNLNLLVDVTAASGTSPSLTVSVEWSPDGGVTWYPADTPDAFAAITATKKAAKQFTVKAPDYRIVWTITGTTPSFTFAIDEYLA